MRKTKAAILIITFIIICGSFIHIQALTVKDETYDEIDMVGKYELTFAAGANVYGYCQGDNPNDIYCDNCNDAVRLPGDNGGRITAKDKNGKLLGWGGNSSSSILSKPSDDAEVVRAYLMQEAEVQADRENVLSDYAMTLKGPKGGSIKPSVNKVFVSDRSINNVGVTYSDVTSFVKQQGFGKYEGWDIPYITKGKNHYGDDYAAWRLIVICEDQELPIRMLRMKMGSGSTTNKTITLKLDGDGFKTKSYGNVTGQIIIGGGGGDVDATGSSLFNYKPSPTAATVSLNTGTNGHMNKSGSFMQSIVTQNGVSRSDIRTLGYRPSDHIPIHNTDLILMDVNSTQSNAKNGHNAYFVNNSNQVTLSATTNGNFRGNLDLFGMLADIDTATYKATMSHSGKLYQNADITMKALFTNNTQANKPNLGVSGGNAKITVDSNMILDTSKITAVYTHNGTKTTLPKSMITVSGNTITVKFGENASGRSYRGDTLEVIFHGHTSKEQITIKNKAVMTAPNWIDETGTIRSFGSLTTMASASDSIPIAFNNPPVITKVNKTFYEDEYTKTEWMNQLRMKDISAKDTEDGNITDDIKVISDTVNVSQSGTYEVKYKVTDAYGKSDTKTSQVIVKYNNPPTILANNREFYENEITSDQWKQMRMRDVEANDIEDGTITENIEIVKDDVQLDIAGTYSVDYKVTDRFGKSTQKHTTVTVKYNNPPTILANNRVFYENEITSDQWKQMRMHNVEANDIEDGNITAGIKIVKDDVLPYLPGIYSIDYSVMDRFGKSTLKHTTVTIKYNNPPTVHAENQVYRLGSITQKQWDEELRNQLATADDIEDGDITNNIKITLDETDVTVPGIYRVKYEVTDRFDKKSDKLITVEIRYNQVPQIEADNITIYENEISNAVLTERLKRQATAYDVEDGDLSDQIRIISNNADTRTPGIYEVTYEVVDSKGAVGTKTIDVTVLENYQPILQLFVSNKRFIEGQYTQNEWEEQLRMKGVTAHDKEDHDLTNQIQIISDTTDPSKRGSYEVVYKVSDRFGKSETKTAKVTVEPNEAPIIYANDKYFTTADTITNRLLLRNVYASDDHDIDIDKHITIQSNAIINGKAGVYAVIYEAIDSLGKKGTKTIQVHITEALEPPITPPLPDDVEALYLWNGHEHGLVNITKLMEPSIIGHDKEALKDVVFGIYAKEDIIYQNRVVLVAGSLVAITKVDAQGQLNAIIHHKGKYVLKELQTNNHYFLDEKEYEFEYR